MQRRETAQDLLYKKDKTFLLQHRTTDAPYQPDTWGIFGGGLEGDEKPIEAVKRELWEEIEYRVRLPRFIFTTNFEYGDRLLIQNVFIEEYDESQPIVLHEGQGFGWFSISQMQRLVLSADLEAMLPKLLDELTRL